jgi:hypothetical protein
MTCAAVIYGMQNFSIRIGVVIFEGTDYHALSIVQQ